jgi:hypothetical protein
MKGWTSPVYAFFDQTPQIVEIDGHRAHDFKCGACGCKVKIRWYLDMKDAGSTSNMHKHVKACRSWGPEVLKQACKAKDVKEARMKIIGTFLWDGTITTSFKQKSQGQVTYSNRQHTCTESRYI